MTQLNLFPDPEPLTCLCVDEPLKGQTPVTNATSGRPHVDDPLILATDPEDRTWRTLVLFYDHSEALANADAYHIETYSRRDRRTRPTHTKETHE